MKQELTIGYTESAPRGKKIYADIPGRKRERISIVAGWIGKKFIAPMTFKGGCDKEVMVGEDLNCHLVQP